MYRSDFGPARPRNRDLQALCERRTVQFQGERSDAGQALLEGGVRNERSKNMNEVLTAQTENRAVIRPEADVVAASVADLRYRMRGLIGAGVRDLVVDLSGVQMVDSAGLGLLISAHNSLRK